MASAWQVLCGKHFMWMAIALMLKITLVQKPWHVCSAYKEWREWRMRRNFLWGSRKFLQKYLLQVGKQA